jgi:hypothetical protein
LLLKKVGGGHKQDFEKRRGHVPPIPSGNYAHVSVHYILDKILILKSSGSPIIKFLSNSNNYFFLHVVVQSGLQGVIADKATKDQANMRKGRSREVESSKIHWKQVYELLNLHRFS